METENLDTLLDNINNNISELNKTDNLNDILKLYSETKDKINMSNSIIDNIKKKYEKYEKKDLSNVQIDDETYQQYLNDIDIINNKYNYDNAYSLEEQYNDYKNLSEKIHLCTLYLESKKLHIVNCD